MVNSSQKRSDSVESVLHQYGNTLYRLCFVILGNGTDAEDAVQETIIKYIQKAPRFENAEHEKAWLLRVAANQSRDLLRMRKRRREIPLEKISETAVDVPDSGILDALMALPEKFCVVLTLYYVEECSIDEIARSIGRTPSAVKMRLQKGRKLLAEKYRKEYL